MTTYLSDTFTRANTSGGLGTPTTPDSGTYTYFLAGTNTWQVTSNTAGLNGAQNCFAGTAAAVDVDVQVKITSTASANYGVFFRAVDINNYWALGSAGATPLALLHNVAGTLNSWTINSTAIAANDVLRAIAIGRQMYLYKNGVCILETVDSNYTSAGNVAGMFILSNNLPRMDNLVVADPASTDPDGYHTSATGARTYLGRDTQTLDTGAA